jgi:DNA (cytosine-5)-methyltransferase 1
MNGNKLTVGSLFAGIGGIDLGLERTGHFETIWFSEIDTYASKVLAKHWPNVPNYGDIKAIDYGSVPRPDVITGGYPCQPFSTAGKRAGENDPRHLWPECLRAIRQLRPRYALLENVRGHLSLGFSQVLRDLASIGFDAEWQVIPAAALGAPHKRDRLFIVAYPNSGGEALRGQCETLQSQNPSRRDDGSGSGSDIGQECLGSTRQSAQNVAYSQIIGGNGKGYGHNTQSDIQQWLQEQARGSSSQVAHNECKWNGEHWQPANIREKCAGRVFEPRGETPDEQRQGWPLEPSVGRVANGVSSRVDRLRCLGNAVVPQVAELLGNLIWDHSQNA